MKVASDPSLHVANDSNKLYVLVSESLYAVAFLPELLEDKITTKNMGCHRWCRAGRAVHR
jgi:hypothetical protein